MDDFIIPKTSRYRFDVSSMSLRVLLQEWENFDISLACQRNEIWKEEQQQNMIDTLVFNERIPECHIIQEREEAVYHVIDGKQRLTTIVDFLHNKFPWKIKYADPNCLSLFNRKRQLFFKDLPETLRNSILNVKLSLAIYSDMSFQGVSRLFIKLNSGTSLDKFQKNIAANISYRLYFSNLIITSDNEAIFGLFTNDCIKKDKLEAYLCSLLALMFAADRLKNDKKLVAVDTSNEHIFDTLNNLFKGYNEQNQIQIMKEYAAIIKRMLQNLYEYNLVNGAWDIDKKKAYKGSIIYPLLISYVYNLSMKDTAAIYRDFFSYSMGDICGNGQQYNVNGTQKMLDFIEETYPQFVL